MNPKKTEVEEMIEILGITEKEAIRALLSAFAPTQPGALAAAWKHRSNYQGPLPTPTGAEFWCMFETADFRCVKCGSQLRITLDHKNGVHTDHRFSNLEVLCFECNRAKNERGIKHKSTNYRVYRSVVDLFKQTGRFPTNAEIVATAEIDKLNAALYLVRYLEKRLTGKSANLRTYKKRSSPESFPRTISENRAL